MSPLRDTDLLVVNRAGADYKATWLEVKAGVPGGPSYDPDAQDYINRVETADGQALETGVKDAINQLFLSLKAGAINYFDDLVLGTLAVGPHTLSGALQSIKTTYVTASRNSNFVSGDYSRETGLRGADNKYLGQDYALPSDYRYCKVMTVLCDPWLRQSNVGVYQLTDSQQYNKLLLYVSNNGTRYAYAEKDNSLSQVNIGESLYTNSSAFSTKWDFTTQTYRARNNGSGESAYNNKIAVLTAPVNQSFFHMGTGEVWSFNGETQAVLYLSSGVDYTDSMMDELNQILEAYNAAVTAALSP